MDDVLKLPEHLDVAGARSVHEDLLGLRGRAVSIDAEAVRKAGALGLEVLLSAARQWREDGLPFRVAPTSEAFRAACTGLGLDPALTLPEAEASK